MRRVIIESPFRGADEAEEERNVRYARRALHDALKRGESPYASHLLYTQVLDDSDPEERRQGIDAGLAWGQVADASIVYQDYGISSGMEKGIAAAEEQGRDIEYRSIGPNG